jgi:DNA-directed RNA polymerase subunit RPC12/RpoP
MPATPGPALLATRSTDTVYSCPHCNAPILRTNNGDFEASGLRCSRRACRRPIRLTESEPEQGRRYQCKRCSTLLFESPTQFGRVWMCCGNPSCHHNSVPQTVFLGGNVEGPAPRIVGRVHVVVGTSGT